MDANIEMLNYIYKNSQMGQETINHLLEIVTDDSSFRKLLENQFNEYKNIFDKSESIMQTAGHDPKGTNSLQKFEAYMMINMKTINDKSPDHISEMLIVGSTMGVIQIIRRMHQYTDSIDKDVENMAKKLLVTEQHNIDECKKFLGKNLETTHA